MIAFYKKIIITRTNRTNLNSERKNTNKMKMKKDNPAANGMKWQLCRRRNGGSSVQSQRVGAGRAVGVVLCVG